MSLDHNRIVAGALAKLATAGFDKAAAPKTASGRSGLEEVVDALADATVTEIETHFEGGGSGSTGAAVAQFTIGDGTSKDITITHNLGTQQIVDVALRRVSDNSRRYVGWTAPTEDTVVLGTFGIAPGESSLVASISYIPPTQTTPS